MSLPRTRSEFKNYVLDNMGRGLLEINVTDVQIEHCIDSALLFLQDYHMNFSDTKYFKHQLTAEDIQHQYIELPPDILDVVGVFNPGLMYGGNVLGSSMAYYKYNLVLTTLPNLIQRQMFNMIETLQYMEEINYYLGNKLNLRYNRNDNIAYIDANWALFTVGTYLILNCKYQCIGNELWQERLFIDLTEQMIRLRWGENLSKYSGSLGLNGVQFNGEQMKQDAERRITEIKEEVKNNFAIYPNILIG